MFSTGANTRGSAGFEGGTHCFADHFLKSAQSLRTGKSGAAGQANGARGLPGKGPQGDAALAERVGGEGGNQR